MIRKNKSSPKNQKGSMVVETAMGMVGFLMMIFYWVEVSYMGFVSSLVDYAVAEASREARTGPSDDYLVEFKKILDDTDSIWAQFMKAENFNPPKTYYYKSVNALTAENCDGSDSDCIPELNSTEKPLNSPIAVYQVSYRYQPLSASLFLDPDTALNISREVITVQEYEREKFK